MKPLARKTAALTLTAALVAGSLPRAAWANNPPVAAAPTGAPKTSNVDASAPMQQLASWGVFSGPNDVLRTYFVTGGKMTPLGLAIYQSLAKTHGTGTQNAAWRADEIAGMKATFDSMRENGPYASDQQKGVEDALRSFEKAFSGLKPVSDPSLEAEYERGALREALMTGANVAPQPKAGAQTQRVTEDGVEIWDRNGLVFKLNKNNATTYSRQLQKIQHAYNQNRPPEVAFIPETGRYNPEFFDYSYHSLDNQYKALLDGYHRDRAIALAELLGATNRFKQDMWYTDPTVEADLVAEARHKVYRHRGQDYNVLDIVDKKFKQRLYYLGEARKAVERYKSDEDDLKAAFKTEPVVSDGQANNMRLDEQYARRFLTLATLENMSYYVKGQIERLDPASPDAEQIMKALDESSLSPAEKAAYKLKAVEMTKRLKAMSELLERTRGILHSTYYAANLQIANATLASVQRANGQVAADYSLFLEAPTLAFVSQEQTHTTWLGWGSKLTRWGYGVYSSKYKGNMDALERDQPKYLAVMRQIAQGDMAGARQAVIAMNPTALKGNMAMAISGPSQPVTEAQRLAASLQSTHQRVADVFETNKWLDSAGSFITWTVDMALLAPVVRWGADGLASKLGAFTGEAQEVSALSRFGLVKRPAIILRETLLHTSARLKSLETDPAIIARKTDSAILQYALASGGRAIAVASRQAAFTGMSAGISGAFTLGQHFWDMGTAKLIKPGESFLGVRPGHTMYEEDAAGALDAFWTGAKGGIWWANTPIEVGGVPVLHPAMLGYVGLPTTAFRDWRIMRYMEMVGSRGVVGSAVGSGKLLLGIEAAEGEAAGGFLERLAQKGALGYTASFGLSMTDNIAKYALFSDGVGWLGNQYAYHWGKWANEQDVERHIKGANAEGQKWLASPAWMLIPTYSANAIREGQQGRRAMEAVKQAKESDEASGTMAERLRIANTLDESLPQTMLKPERPPISQTIFEYTFKPAEESSKFFVTKDVRRGVVKDVLTELLGGKGAKPEQLAPEKLFRVMKMEPGTTFGGLKVDKVVTDAASDLFVEALARDPQRAETALKAELGTHVEGFGYMMPEMRREIATKLYASKKPLAAGLQAQVDAVMSPVSEATGRAAKPSDALVEKLAKAPKDSPALDAAADDAINTVTDWMKDPSQRPYMEVAKELQGKADALKAEGKLTAAEHDLLTAAYDYVDGVQQTFNAFNEVGKTYKKAMESVKALRTRYSGHAEVQGVLDEVQGSLDAWKNGRAEDAVADTGASGDFQKMMRSLDSKLAQAKLGDAERASVQDALAEMKASPWVFRNTKGEAIGGWRPVQFESLMYAVSTLIKDSRAGNPPRFFLKLKTGGGKTLLSSVGLLPFLEADSRAQSNHPTPIYLVPQANLEAQVRQEFAAFGVRVKTDTYEGFKSKIAEGKRNGRDVTMDYTPMGDEGDAATQQPILTIGQVSGMISKTSPVFNRLQQLGDRISNRLDGTRQRRASVAQIESSRVTLGLKEYSPGGAKQTLAEAARKGAAELESASADLAEARGPRAVADAESAVRSRAGELQKTLAGLGDEAPVVEARQALTRLVEGLDGGVASAPPPQGRLGKAWDALTGKTPEQKTAALREDVVADVSSDLKRQNNLLDLAGSEQGLRRLGAESEKRAAELESQISRLTEQKRVAETAGMKEQARALDQEIGRAKRSLEFMSRFDSRDGGQQLARLQEKIAAADANPGSVPVEKVAEWKAQLQKYYRDWAGTDPPRNQTARSHADALKKLYSVEHESLALEEEIFQARKAGKPLEGLEARREALGRDLATARADAERLKGDLSAGSAGSADAARSDLGGLMRRLDVLRSRETELQGKIDRLRTENKATGEASSELASVRRERAQVLDRALDLARERLKDSGADVLKTVKEGRPGWEEEASGLMTERSRLLDSFGADENPLYGVFREIKDRMSGYAMRTREATGGAEETWGARIEKRLDAMRADMKARGADDAAIQQALDAERARLSDAAPLDRSANDVVIDQMLKDVSGKSLWRVAPKVLKMTFDVFRGKEPDVNPSEVGLTRVYAAKMLKALFDDPAMNAHDRTNLFWHLAGSLLSPGEAGKSSWVRTELLSMYQGYFDDPAKVRFDNLTGRINVVHNGEWFESMDTKTRRFWELNYGADLTLPYTNQSMSTIRDITTNQKSRFIMFSGTVPERLEQHLGENKIPIAGKGSERPEDMELRTVAGQADGFKSIPEALANQLSSRGEVALESLEGAPEAVRSQIEGKLGGPVKGTRVVKLADFATPELADARAWLEGLHSSRGDASRVVLEPAAHLPRLTETEATAVRERLKTGGLDAKTQRALQNVLDMREVTPEERSALESELKGWTSEPLSGVRESVEAQVKSNVPLEVRKTVDAYLQAKKWGGKEKVVVDIADVKGATPAETQAVQQWLRDVRSAQGDTGVVFVVVPDTRQLKTVVTYLKKVYGLTDKEISIVFSDTTKLGEVRPEAKVAEQMNLSGLKNKTTKVVVGDARTFARGLDLSLKKYSSFEMVILDPQNMDGADVIQAAGRIDRDRTLPGANRDFSLVMNVQSIKNLESFRDLVIKDPFFSELRGDPAFVSFVKAAGDGRSPANDLSLYHDYVTMRSADGTTEGKILSDRYDQALAEGLKEQQRRVETEKLTSSGVLTEAARTGGVFPGVERAR